MSDEIDRWLNNHVMHGLSLNDVIETVITLIIGFIIICVLFAVLRWMLGISSVHSKLKRMEHKIDFALVEAVRSGRQLAAAATTVSATYRPTDRQH